MNRHALLQRILEVLNRDFPQLVIDSTDGDEVLIRTSTKDGFDIKIDVSTQENTLQFGPWHDHFEPNEPGERELIQLIGYGLSKLGRVKVTSKGQQVVRSAFEVVDESGTWVVYSETGSILFNPFAKTTIAFLQNDVIPIDAIRSIHTSTTE